MEPNTRQIITAQPIEEGKRLRAQQFRQQPTAAEQTLWHHLRARRQDGLHFRRQQNIDGFIADFYCHQAALVVEVDGAVHVAQTNYDAERDRIFRQRGLRVLRVSNDDVQRRLPDVLARVRAAAQERPAEHAAEPRKEANPPAPLKGDTRV